VRLRRRDNESFSSSNNECLTVEEMVLVAAIIIICGLMMRTMKMGLIGSSRAIISMMSGIEIIKNRMKGRSLMNRNR
jgi:hypothetical protein